MCRCGFARYTSSLLIIIILLCGEWRPASGGVRQLLQNYLYDGNLANWLPAEVISSAYNVK
eukprot:jgi/Botrbrau1/4483/Bobra.0220s0017.1